MAGFFDGLTSMFASDSPNGGALSADKVKKEFKLGDTSHYFKPGSALVDGPNSLTAAGIGEDVSTMSKVKGAAGSLFNSGEKDLGALYNDVDFEDPANDELLGVIADTESEIAANNTDEGPDWEKFAAMLKSIKPHEDEPIRGSSGGRVGGGFRFDERPYQNQLLQREFQQLYNQPLYKKPV